MNEAIVEATSKAVRSKRRKLLLEITAYLSPVIIIIVVFVFAPLTIILFYSFLKSGIYGEIVYSFSLENFRAILTGGYGIVFLQSIYLRKNDKRTVKLYLITSPHIYHAIPKLANRSLF